MRCSVCGYDNPAEALYCGGCGSRSGDAGVSQGWRRSKAYRYRIHLGIAVLGIVGILVGIFVTQVRFGVDDSQYAIVTRSGNIHRTITEPGQYAKAPFIDKVSYLPKEILTFSLPLRSVATEDKELLTMDFRVQVKILDPAFFFERIRTVTNARDRVVRIIESLGSQEIATKARKDITGEELRAIESRVLDAAVPFLEEMGLLLLEVRIELVGDSPVSTE